ncbi:unnamed protein product [Didymodactylos carnosus]|uniref:Uncharacterized protein n=1 Tax=Didymodactylos carnosus TaxID=1234261 RepID=A0A8S2GNC9_9BILA|nr:unnamed protein product [Didymodactylos carnosus]CAF3538888.1 unnamed protein product [Didymodactylos carnosus]
MLISGTYILPSSLAENEESLTTINPTINVHKKSPNIFSTCREKVIVPRLSNVSNISKYSPQKTISHNGHDSTEIKLNGSVKAFAKTTTDNILNISSEDNDEKLKYYKFCKNLIFTFEPIFSGFILLPIIALFWQTGWNLTLITLKFSSSFNMTLHVIPEIVGKVNETTTTNQPYWYLSLIIPYFISQFILLVIYLSQNLVYNCIKFKYSPHSVCYYLFLKIHIFILGTIYIVQWTTLWTLWDQYILNDYYFKLLLSLAAIFVLIVLNGNLCNLVCAPLVISYDSVDFSIQIECPLSTEKMNQYAINIINYILYEYCVSILTILSWAALLQTSSSINGPSSSMPDYLNLFPLYPNYYLTFFLMDQSMLAQSKQILKN